MAWSRGRFEARITQLEKSLADRTVGTKRAEAAQIEAEGVAEAARALVAGLEAKVAAGLARETALEKATKALEADLAESKAREAAVIESKAALEAAHASERRTWWSQLISRLSGKGSDETDAAAAAAAAAEAGI